MKKIISLISVLAIVFSMATITNISFAETPVSADLTFVVEKGTFTTDDFIEEMGLGKYVITVYLETTGMGVVQSGSGFSVTNTGTRVNALGGQIAIDTSKIYTSGTSLGVIPSTSKGTNSSAINSKGLSVGWYAAKATECIDPLTDGGNKIELCKLNFIACDENGTATYNSLDEVKAAVSWTDDNRYVGCQTWTAVKTSAMDTEGSYTKSTYANFESAANYVGPLGLAATVVTSATGAAEKPEAGKDMVNPATGNTEKTIVSRFTFDNAVTAPKMEITLNGDEETREYDSSYFPANVMGGSVKILAILRYASNVASTGDVFKMILTDGDTEIGTATYVVE